MKQYDHASGDSGKKNKIGLVLEGGSMRGLFTAGVLDVMLDAGIAFDGAVGTSAGAAFGCNFKSKQRGRVLRYTTRFARDPRFAGFRSLIKTGDIFNAEFGYETIPSKYDPFDYETFEKNPMEFYACATDCETGQAFYHKFRDARGEDAQWFRASASMPVVSKPVRLRGRLFLDGGMSDSIPLKFMERKGYERNVVVLTRAEEYVKEPMKYMPMIRYTLRHYPRIIRAIEVRPKKYNKRVAYIRRRAKEGEVLIIRPPEELNIAAVCHDPNEMRRVYRIGVETMRGQLNELRQFMGL